MSPRNSQRSTSSSGSSLAHQIPDPNVFSDDYALEPLNTDRSSPFNADDDPTPASETPPLHTGVNISRPISPVSSVSSSAQPPTLSHRFLGHRDVFSIIPNRTASRASNTFSDVHRASSTSSHFSMPRAQSPYVGATGPSHPYGMYPQITRTSSIASASTVRPIERPFVTANGPEHPYAMYSQNTVPEEDDASLAQATIPVDFPGMGQPYRSGGQTRRDDVSDIVGSDGHIEELPPYTRFADEIAPKESLPSIQAVHLPAVVPQEVPMSPQSRHTQHVETVVELSSTSSRNGCSNSSVGFKEKIKQKGRQRVCGGLPFWFFFVIIGVLLLGVVLGAIIGGVIGSQKGASPSATADPYQNSSHPTATVTSTAFIDGVPLATGQPVASVPTGQYNVPTNGNEVNSKACIKNHTLVDTWGCLASSGMGITVTGQGWGASITLDSYPLSSSFMYGAQPPDLGTRPLDLTPSMDQDSSDLGPSLFAFTYYDKLTILHEQALIPNGQYRRKDDSHIYGMPEDKPWFCWFNETLLEFFIYVDKSVNSSATTPAATATPSSPSTTPSTFTTPSSTTLGSSLPPPAAFTGKPSGSPYGPPEDFVNHHTTESGYNRRRSDDKLQKRKRYDDYPLLMKVEEKRKPRGNVPPYCQQMQVLDSGEIVPVPYVAQISVQEIEDMDDDNQNRFRRRGDAEDLSRGCACEWISW
ncbi:hypothetical protein EPUS_00046 [Endocarpon pusillum Z07020]|uniref:DUF7820 domain-containing protein n=1 Tax=Endocarpon pusillum (strain Z07020 / HMAS-L-300199) TaxID=1263415 RepID=U1I085_ENDPU|nr:uncharacterized protein EPUS_00046 [Endocarpon pusillum Z07020]ERF75254.1 hypothetical protein EPUS_00046 [Endocarpon pusillum Z07020]